MQTRSESKDTVNCKSVMLHYLLQPESKAPASAGERGCSLEVCILYIALTRCIFAWCIATDAGLHCSDQLKLQCTLAGCILAHFQGATTGSQWLSRTMHRRWPVRARFTRAGENSQKMHQRLYLQFLHTFR